MADLDDQVKQRISGLSDKDLIKMLTASPDEYLPEALAFAQSEAQRRGIQDISVDAINRLEQKEAREAEQAQPAERENKWQKGLSIGLGLLLFFGWVGFKAYRDVMRQVDPHSIKAVFPGVSDQALRAFNRRVSNSGAPSPGLGREIFETLARGEALLSQEERDEMVELHWKAVATLPEEDKTLVTLHTMGVKSEKDYSPDAQARVSALVQQAFQNLSPIDHQRYMALRVKSFELGAQVKK